MRMDYARGERCARLMRGAQTLNINERGANGGGGPLSGLSTPIARNDQFLQSIRFGPMEAARKHGRKKDRRKNRREDRCSVPFGDEIVMDADGKDFINTIIGCIIFFCDLNFGSLARLHLANIDNSVVL